MTCTRTRPAWLKLEPDEDGVVNRQITFSQKGSALDADYHIPCGKCEGCAADARRDWAIRMAHEAHFHKYNSFLTLSYSDEHCPEKITVEHIQEFMDRLRKQLKVRYFVTGEYGDQTHRPHYHACIFGADFRGGRHTYDINGKLWGNSWLEAVWRYGQIAIGDFTPASAMYVAGYTAKKINDKDTFSVMSKRPPLGWQWAVKYQDQVHRTGTVVVGGREHPVPKVYFKWQEATKFRPAEVDLDDVKANRQGIARSSQEERMIETNQKGIRRLRNEKI